MLLRLLVSVMRCWIVRGDTTSFRQVEDQSHCVREDTATVRCNCKLRGASQ